MPTLAQRWLPLNIPRCALTRPGRPGIAREGREFTGPLSHKKPGLSSREDAVKRRPRFQAGPGAGKRHPGKKFPTAFNSAQKTSLFPFLIGRPCQSRSLLTCCHSEAVAFRQTGGGHILYKSCLLEREFALPLQSFFINVIVSEQAD